MSDVNQRIACKAVIANKDGRVLILREATSYGEGTQTGRWHMPGGRLNAGEPFLEGLSREINEEAGLRVEVGEPLYIGEWFPIIKDVQNQIVAIFFSCKAITDEVRLSEEHDKFEWVDAESCKQFDIMDPEDKVLEKFFSLPT